MSTEPSKPSDPKAPPTTQDRPRGRPQSGPRAGPPKGDGRQDPGQLKRNQESLHVGDDHKTPEMKKHRRGTFP